MSSQISERLNTTKTHDETFSLIGQKLGYINRAGSNLSTLVTSEEATRQIKAATDPLTRQLERLCDLMRELRQAPPKRNEETSGLIQGSSRSPNHRCDSLG